MPLQQLKKTGDATHTGWLPEDLQTPNGMMGLADALFEGNPDMVLVVSAEGRIAGANSRALTELRYLRRDLEGQPLDLLLPIAVHHRHAGHMENYMKQPTSREMGSCMNLKTRDSRGIEFPVDVMLWPLEAGSRKYVIAVCHRLDASLARAHTQIHALVENAREYAVNLVDAAGRILTWNEGSRRIYNLTGSEALGKYYSILFTTEEVAAGEPERQIEEASSSPAALFSCGWRTGEDGNPIWAEIEFKAARDPNGELSGFSRVLHDLTPYKRAEEGLLEAVRLKAQINADLGLRVAERTMQLATSLDELRAKNEEVEALVTVVSRDLSEKEVLLREVYHRVKNNMQVVQSLLKMGARTLRSSDARSAIETAVQRVYVMAMVHEHLYQMPDLASLALSDFLRDIVEGAIASNCERPAQVQLKLDIDEIPIPLDFAIPLGLLANELVSNCIKHGLPHGRAGTIFISAKIIPGAVRYAVQDDGPGLPENFDATTCPSMGVKLAASLAHQLGGHLEFSSNPGCRVQADLTRLCPQTAVIARTHGQPHVTRPHPMCRA
ncbi:MAG: histidine kinase dimerization/phosphoacceptor domain -containing protein [Terracidiphilus sp.]|jgi:PAS domain S-box-containing protein